jgi:hypothetical protein
LFAEPNALVYSALTFGAVSIAFAIFLIFEPEAASCPRGARALPASARAAPFVGRRQPD